MPGRPDAVHLRLHLQAAEPEALERIEGVGAKTAAAIIEWAQQFEQPAGEETAAAEPAADDLDGGDFMAALSKALKEAEEDDEEVAEGETAAADETEQKPAE